MTFQDGDFVIQYAIRTPTGQLWAGLDRSTVAYIGFFDPDKKTDDDDPPPARPPRCWYNRDSAVKALKDLRRQAAAIGVSDWNGVVVQRLCTPFTVYDPAEEFVTELEEWMEGNAQ